MVATILDYLPRDAIPAPNPFPIEPLEARIAPAVVVVNTHTATYTDMDLDCPSPAAMTCWTNTWQPQFVFSTAMNASCGMFTRPIDFIRFLPSFCFSSSLRLREMSPP